MTSLLPGCSIPASHRMYRVPQYLSKKLYKLTGLPVTFLEYKDRLAVPTLALSLRWDCPRPMLLERSSYSDDALGSSQ